MKTRLFETIAVAAAMLSASAASAQSLTPEILEKVASGYRGTPQEKAVRNALSSTAVSVAATNAENLGMPDTHFSDMVRTKGITDQHRSGRCWLFTGLNVLRAKMIDEYGLESLTFSQNYLFFYDQLEKANLFLQAVIDTKGLPYDDRTVEWLFRNPIGDGGQFTGVSNLIMKYGIVPSEVFPETYSANNTSEMSSLLALKLREFGLELRRSEARPKALQERKTEMLSQIYGMLARTLGVPPAKFEWTLYGKDGKPAGTKEYTPQSFYQEYFGQNLETDYIMVMNDPTREYGKVYEIQYDRHVYDGHNWLYVNLPMDRIKEMAIASIKDNCAMYFSCDVGKFLNASKGTLDVANYDYESLMGTSFGMDKKDRVLTFASGSSHAMTLIAVDLDGQGRPRKWMVENSWGPSSGYEGKLIMTDEWFDEYMFRVVVERKYVPQDILDMFGQKPVVLPPWDPMFTPED